MRETSVGIGLAVAIALGWAGVDEGFLAASQDGPDRLGVAEVVEVTQDDEVDVGIGGERGIDLFTQDFGLFEAKFGFIGFGNDAARFEMSGDKGEGIVGVDLDIHLS